MAYFNDGGAAFPIVPPIDETGRAAVGYPDPEGGMTLLDWFAGQTFPVLLAAAAAGHLTTDDGRPLGPEAFAAAAYDNAEALIAERTKRLQSKVAN